MHLGNIPEEIELQRKLLLMRFFAIAGNVVMVPFMIVSFLYERWLAGIILLVYVVPMTIIIILAHRSRRTGPASATVAAGLWVLSSYLTVSGGVNGTGVYFAFSLVVLMIMIAGLRLGTLLGVGYCAVLTLIFILDPNFAYDYREGTRVRIAASTVFIVLLTIVAEWIHLQSYVAIKFTAETHRRNSLTDPLTSLVNRAGLERRLGQWTNASQLAVVALIDIDHFKTINDQYGHDLGDQVLATFAQLLRNNVKRQDMVCRWGGEEFVILFENITEAAAAEVVDELRKLIASRTLQFEEHELTLQFSAGVASFSGEKGFREGLRRADSRVYEAKRGGRNRVVAAEPSPVMS